MLEMSAKKNSLPVIYMISPIQILKADMTLFMKRVNRGVTGKTTSPGGRKSAMELNEDASKKPVSQDTLGAQIGPCAYALRSVNLYNSATKKTPQSQ